MRARPGGDFAIPSILGLDDNAPHSLMIWETGARTSFVWNDLCSALEKPRICRSQAAQDGKRPVSRSGLSLGERAFTPEHTPPLSWGGGWESLFWRRRRRSLPPPFPHGVELPRAGHHVVGGAHNRARTTRISPPQGTEPGQQRGRGARQRDGARGCWHPLGVCIATSLRCRRH